MSIAIGVGVGVVFGAAAGVAASSWTPADLGPMVWLDPLESGDVTRAAQPTIPGSGWSGANWSGSGSGPYTHSTGATTALANAVLTIGNRYLTSTTVSSRTAGTVTAYHGATAGTARSANGAYTDEMACATNTSHSYVPSSDFDGSVTIGSVENLSIASIDPHSGSTLTDAFAQPTAAAQPWADSTTDWITFDGYADQLQYSGAASDFTFLHYSTSAPGNYPEFTVALCVTPAAPVSAVGTLLYNGAPGIRLYITAEMAVVCAVYNASVALASCSSANAVLTVGTGSVVVMTAGSAGVHVYVDGTLVASDTTWASTPSSADPGVALYIGSYGSANRFAGSYGDIIILDYAADSTERASLEAYLAAKHGL